VHTPFIVPRASPVRMPHVVLYGMGPCVFEREREKPYVLCARADMGLAPLATAAVGRTILKKFPSVLQLS
jgi:hypothetical protein